MKYLTRYLSVLLCCLLLLTAFSISASAEEKTEFGFWYGFKDSFDTSGGRVDASGITGNYTFDWNKAPTQTTAIHPYIKIFGTGDNEILATKGKTVNFRLSNIVLGMMTQSVTDSSFKKAYLMQKFDNQELVVEYIDGSLGYFEVEHSFNSGTSTSEFTSTFEAKKDVKSISVNLEYIPINRMGNSVLTLKFLYFQLYGSPSNANIEIPSKEAGLLGGIIDWLKGIKNGISDLFSGISNGFSNLGNAISNVFNSILELPEKIWNFISEGLKSLFVPDEEYMTSYRDKWDELLGQRFGAIYQVGDIIVDFVGNIRESDATNTVEFPEVSYTFSGAPFVFGGYDVKIVPDGFSFLAEICKLITSVVCTLLFINGLRRKYDEVMGVPNNDN